MGRLVKLVKKYPLQFIAGTIVVFIFTFATIFLLSYNQSKQLNNEIASLQSDKFNLNKQLAQVGMELAKLKSEDQYKINKDLQVNIKNIETTYNQAVRVYEKLLDLKDVSTKTDKFDAAFSDSLALLSKLNYASASAELATLSSQIDSEMQTIASSFQIPQNITASNMPPGSGYSTQSVHSDVGDFMVEIVAADLGSTRVIVDTASDGDCSNNCPVLSLGDYVLRNGAFAGINGSFFCPADYPSCSGKTNSFDTLLMNKNKHYFNSDNNVYSTIPAAIFSGNSARYVVQSLQWGRDTGVDAVIANHPLLTLNGQISLAGNSSEGKLAVKSSRGFVGNTGSTVYIGVIFNSTTTEAAHVLQTMGIQNSLGLDDGGSTALWSGGYKAGPGRNIPDAVLFVRK